MSLCLQECSPVSSHLAKSKAAFEFFVVSEPQLINSKSIERLQKDLSVELLYPEKMIRGPTNSFCLSRDYLIRKCFDYIQHPANNKIIYATTFGSFDNRENSKYAIQTLANICAWAFNAAPAAPPSYHVPALDVAPQ